MAATKSTKNVTVLVRYQIKKDCPEKGLRTGDVVLLVENGEGKQYTVTLRRNKCHSCSCDGYVKSNGRRKCYHINASVTLENARAAARVAQKRAAAQAETLELAEIDTTPNERGNYRNLLALALAIEAEQRATAPLHSAGRGFSLLKTS